MIEIKNTSENKIFYATTESAGFDICSTQDTWVEPGEVVMVDTGLYLEPSDHSVLQPYTHDMVKGESVLGEPFTLIPELQIRSRSGLAAKHRVFVINSPGTIDRDYPNEIKVLLYNAGKETFGISKGDRIAQGIVAFVGRAANVPIRDDLRTGGFGSTGTKS